MNIMMDPNYDYNEMKLKSYTTAERIKNAMQNHTNAINVVKYFNVYLHK
jgi:hypothetical protein